MKQEFTNEEDTVLETGRERHDSALSHAQGLDETAEEGEKLVMVGRFLDPSEAQMAKGMLEAAGIDCFIQGENANALFSGVFRARLEVRHADEEAARSLMAEATGGTAEGQEDSDLA